MLFPAEMRKLTIGIHKAYTHEVIGSLHEAGLMEVTNIWDTKGNVCDLLSENERPVELSKLGEYNLRIAGIQDSFRVLDSEGQNLLSEFFRPRIMAKISVQERDIQDIFEDVEETVMQSEESVAMKGELMTISEQMEHLKDIEKSIALLNAFDFNLEYLGESTLTYTVAVTTESQNAEYVHDIVSDLSQTDLLMLDREVDGKLVLVFITHVQNKTILDELLRNRIFEPLSIPARSGKPSDVLRQIKDELEEHERRRTQLLSEISKIEALWGDKLKLLREELEIEIERRSILSLSGRTRDVVVMEGWIPARDGEWISELCEDHSGGHAFCECVMPEANPENIPTMYDNPRWLRPFEFITTMFSRPKYNEVDPTILIGPIMIVYFGLMLGDAVYGLVLTVLAALLYRGAGQVSRTMHDISLILLAAGSATIILGVMQGGYLGDILPRFFGIQPPFVILNSLENPILFLQLALVIGILQINLGLVAGAFQNIRHGMVKDFITDQVSWFIIQPCAALILFDFFGWMPLSPITKITAIAGSLLGVGIIFKKEGPLGFFSLTGFLGDWLSYARLLALALATGGIAMTVNILSSMVAGAHPFLAVLAVFVFLVGQTFNFTLQSLGAFVHSLRLQYVEFFGKFYTGGGREFSPFAARREHTVLVRGDS